MSHAFVVMNDAGVEASQDAIPGFSEIATSRRPDVQNMGDRGILGTGLKRAWRATLFMSEIPIPVWGEMFKEALEHLRESGITSFGSRLDHGIHMSAYKYLLRTEDRLPIRYASSLEIHRNEFMSATAVESVYTQMGAMWQDAETCPWMWITGISSEGAWGAPGSACMGPDLEAVSPEQKEVEQCVDLDNPTPELTGLQNALQNGWRIVAIHASGTHDLRTIAQFIEQALDESPTLTEEFVRDMEIGFAHGTMIGTPDLVMGDVYERIKNYNAFVPINVSRAFTEEPDVVVQRYGEEALNYLAPVRTLLDEGVKVVGESENTDPDPEWYFEVLNAYVNRFTVREGDHADEPVSGDTDQYLPEEGISLVEALKLITIRSAEFAKADEVVGSLEPGKRADFCVLENELLDCPESDDLRDNKVIAVTVDGQIEHMEDEAENAITTEDQE